MWPGSALYKSVYILLPPNSHLIKQGGPLRSYRTKFITHHDLTKPLNNPYLHQFLIFWVIQIFKLKFLLIASGSEFAGSFCSAFASAQTKPQLEVGNYLCHAQPISEFQPSWKSDNLSLQDGPKSGIILSLDPTHPTASVFDSPWAMGELFSWAMGDNSPLD